MLPASSLSSAAYSLRNLLVTHIDELDDINHIKIGHPGDTIKDLEDFDENCLNLFFYDVIYDGYPADGSSENPFYVRLHCLITAVGHKSKEPEAPGSAEERDVSKGENELRLVGEVMRLLHEQPVLLVADAAANTIAELQVIPHNMNLDNLNHIWSTQSDISYRLSVAYEMALAPVPYALPTRSAPVVGDSQMVSWGARSRDQENEKDGLISLQPQVELLEIDVSSDDWMPHICFVETLEDTSQQLHYVFKVEGALDVAFDVLVAGKDLGTVKLVWNLWRRKTDNSIVAWQQDIADTELPVEKEIKDGPASSETFVPNSIDPDDIDPRRIFKVKLPAEAGDADTKTWQAMLYAVREWNHEYPSGSGEFITTSIKSNSVLLYGDSA
ncbi:MAG: DUF4255 domain-containing protein [Gammaproteobacteria bacterium]|nr:DUF4255 domain-containing protein [Gammaproteobacteria bacterium]